MRTSFAKFGYPEGILPRLGLIELAFAALYMIPQTSMLGAILLTAYLGGATATHVPISDPLWIVPVVIGVRIWAGLYLRDARLSSLVPLPRKG